jgi:hypothetical protein
MPVNPDAKIQSDLDDRILHSAISQQNLAIARAMLNPYHKSSQLAESLVENMQRLLVS